MGTSLYRKKILWIIVLVSFLFALQPTLWVYAKTPPELDATIEKFKTETDREARLDLSYVALDKYAPLKEKSKVDRTDRDALSEMKRLVITDLMERHRRTALVTAIGSTGSWLINPNKIMNDYDETKKDDIAKYKYQGYYMEGLSDLDFVIMGAQAKSLANDFYDTLAKGRAGVDVVPEELQQLEIAFIIDEQIRQLESGGDTRRFWKQVLNVEASSPHPEKYITKGGKALYCVEHLWLRGGAIRPGQSPVKFSEWSKSAGHEIGPFTAQYLYGGCCDMDYFMRHAFEKTKQEKVKTVLQVMKYLSRQAWMLEQSKEHAKELPDGLKLLEDRVEHLGKKTLDLRAFCEDQINRKVWNSDAVFAGFREKALKKSSDICYLVHGLTIGMGRDLLWRLEQDILTEKQAIVLHEIAYDLETIHNDRYHKRPEWYEVHTETVVKETLEFLADYKKAQPKAYKVFARAGVLKPEDKDLTATEIGPIKPPPVVKVRVKDVNMNPEHPKAGDSVVFTGICELEGVLEDDPNWKDDWFTPNQREAMKNLGIWSWMTLTRRIQIEYLAENVARNRGRNPPPNPAYVSPYEIAELAEELREFEEEVAKNAKALGQEVPKFDIKRFKPNLQATATLSAPDDYLKTLEQTCKDAKEALEKMQKRCDTVIAVAEKAKDKNFHSSQMGDISETLKELKTKSKSHIEATTKALGEIEKYTKIAQDIKKVFSGDIGHTAGKAKELADYLEQLSHETEMAVLDATATQNKLANGINLFRRCAKTVPEDKLPGLRQELTDSVREWDREKNDIMLRKIPELQERAKWLNRGAWAAKSVKVALDTVLIVQDYHKTYDNLKMTDMSYDTKKAVMALKACGDIITFMADKIPITVLRQTIKDYASILKQAPQWAAAFDKMVSNQRQFMGYNLRIEAPIAYKKVIESNPHLTAVYFFRDQGPFSKLNELIVFGHPQPAPKHSGAGTVHQASSLPDLGTGQFWLIWDPHRPDGYLKLDSESYAKASKYASWYRRVFGKNIEGPELKDLLIDSKIEGTYFWNEDISVFKLKRQAAEVLRWEAFKNYLSKLTGRTEFEPDQLRIYYGLLDQAARQLAANGFLMKNRDARYVIGRVRLDAPVSGSWITVLKSVPVIAGLSDLINSTAAAWDSLSSGQKQRLQEAVKELIEKKREVRADARKAYWGEMQETTPAGLKFEDLRVIVSQSVVWKDGNIQENQLIKTDKPTFKFELKASLPEAMVGEAAYVCSAYIRGYEGSADNTGLDFTATKLEETTKPEPKTQEPNQVDVCEDCRIPESAYKVERPKKVYYMLNNRRVGPFTSWWDAERTQRMSYGCFDAEGKLVGKSINWHENGTIGFEGDYVDGEEEGIHRDFNRDGILLSEKTDVKGKLNGLYVTYYNGKPKEKGYFRAGRRDGIWHYFSYDGFLECETRYENGKREGIETYYDEEGRIRWQYEYKDDRWIKMLDKDGKVEKVRKYLDDGTIIEERVR